MTKYKCNHCGDEMNINFPLIQSQMTAIQISPNSNNTPTYKYYCHSCMETIVLHHIKETHY